MEEFFGDRLFNALERNEPKAGMLLVSAPGMSSPEFERSVVLIVEHGPDLTFGVDLSKRSDYAVYNVMPEWTPYLAKPQAFFIGGPVNQNSVVAIGVTKSEVVIEEHPGLQKLANRIVHISFPAEPESVGDLIEGARLFVGFAGWGPGQLDYEIERGDWYVAPALVSDILAAGSVDVWGDVMRRQPLPLPLFSTFPADLENN